MNTAVGALKKSWELTWDNLELARFETFGVIARRGPDDIACFNIAQSVWLYPRVRMDWSSRRSRGCETFAVNVLARCVGGPKVQTYAGVAAQKAIDYAPLFMEECLLTMPHDGGCIPLEYLAAWIRDKFSWRRLPHVVAARKAA